MDRQVYFAQCGDKIKIGVTVNALDRLQQLQQGSGEPIELIACIAGDYSTEAALHNKLQQFRINGEWFRDCPEVRAAIQNSLNNFPSVEPRERMQKRAAKFKAVCRVIWPTNTADALAEIAGTDRRTGSRWLSGQSEAPASVYAAILAELVKRD